MAETDVSRGATVLRVRDVGDPHGRPVVYFHGTPGSRLDMAFADDLATELGVRLVSFDRPGYGGSTAAPFGLVSVARDTAFVADQLGFDRFATLGQSGGGPFALSAAAVLGSRVTRAGVASGPGPFALVSGGLDSLDANDRAAEGMLPGDPIGAARGFAAGFEPLVPIFRDSSHAEIVLAFHDMLSSHDLELMQDERLARALATSMKESLRQGSGGAGGWDNVAWVGPWEIDPTTIDRPVLLWYGDEDLFCSPQHGIWLRDMLPDVQFTLRSGEGHLGYMEHTTQMLTALTA